jgi:hypothetical protein
VRGTAARKSMAPYPICTGRCGACHRARVRATRWHRQEQIDLSPAGRGEPKRCGTHPLSSRLIRALSILVLIPVLIWADPSAVGVLIAAVVVVVAVVGAIGAQRGCSGDGGASAPGIISAPPSAVTRATWVTRTARQTCDRTARIAWTTRTARDRVAWTRASRHAIAAPGVDAPTAGETSAVHRAGAHPAPEATLCRNQSWPLVPVFEAWCYPTRPTPARNSIAANAVFAESKGDGRTLGSAPSHFNCD